MPTSGAPVTATDQLFWLACRIAVNRTVARVHFPADSVAGAVLGIQLGRWLLARAMPVGAMAAASFDGRRFVDAGDQPRNFHYGVLDMMVTGKDGSTRFGTRPISSSLRPCSRARSPPRSRNGTRDGAESTPRLEQSRPPHGARPQRLRRGLVRPQ
ncbi:hypothetical protein [Paracoccus sediminilitoris]|uniref:hypothetical protein n=1 Tax=Paracoccus sediminilitoris TaxID=2202419 RepID=UPI003898F97B